MPARRHFYLQLPAAFTLLLLASSCASRITVMSYNVENLFDTVDSGSEYPEFRGERWNRELFEEKCAAIARVIRKAGPDVVALQEVESLEALLALRDRYLRGLGYRHASLLPRAGTATGVALLSRIPVRRTRFHAVGDWEGLPQRPILEAELTLREAALVLFVLHWKSRSGGEAQTEPARMLAAGVLAARIRELLLREPATDILVAGDFNEDVEEHLRRPQVALAPAGPSAALLVTDRPERAGLAAGRPILYDCWYERARSEWGSTVYRGRWETPDRMLLSSGLFDGAGFALRRGSFRPFRAAFLLGGSEAHPLRWRSEASPGRRGFSDHLPVLVGLEAR